MIKYAIINLETGQCEQIASVQEAFAANDRSYTPEGHLVLHMDSDINEQEYTELKYYRNNQWHDRDPCPGDNYSWTNFEWVFDNSTMWAEIKAWRNNLLRQSDWTQMADCPLSGSSLEAWRVYRQTLRDIPEDQPNVDKLKNVIWPDTPS